MDARTLESHPGATLAAAPRPPSRGLPWRVDATAPGLDGPRADASYAATRDRLAAYFGHTDAEAWERLTSDAPVSRIRRTVRAGRLAMREAILARLPDDMAGMRVLDAGCGPGDLAVAMARRGARVTAVDLSGSLLAVARHRTPEPVAHLVRYERGDMLADRGRFDATVAMDSLIHYETPDVAGALAVLAGRSPLALFTVAPRTPLLALMHAAGRLLPASDRAPRIVPHGARALVRAVAAEGLPAPRAVARVHRGFYVSELWEIAA